MSTDATQTSLAAEMQRPTEQMWRQMLPQLRTFVRRRVADPNRADPLKTAAMSFFGRAAFARTLTDERESARAVLSHFARRGDEPRLEAALARRRYAVSETLLADGGFEKRTRSAFGLFGEVVTRAAPR